MENKKSKLFHTMPVPIESSVVYFLMFEGRLQYVGKSKKFFSRISSHIGAKKFDRVEYIHVSPEDVDALEIAFIKYYRPPLNLTKHPPLTIQEEAMIAPFLDSGAPPRFAIQDRPTPEHFGPVAFFVADEEIVSHRCGIEGMEMRFGIYDDDDAECDADCAGLEKLARLEEIFPKKVTDEMREQALESCACEPRAIVYDADGRDGYWVTDRGLLFDVSDATSRENFAELADLEIRVVEARFGVKLNLGDPRLQYTGGD